MHVCEILIRLFIFIFFLHFSFLFIFKNIVTLIFSCGWQVLQEKREKSHICSCQMLWSRQVYLKRWDSDTISVSEQTFMSWLNARKCPEVSYLVCILIQIQIWIRWECGDLRFVKMLNRLARHDCTCKSGHFWSLKFKKSFKICC